MISRKSASEPTALGLTSDLSMWYLLRRKWHGWKIFTEYFCFNTLSSLHTNLLLYVAFTRRKNGRNLGDLKNALSVIKKYRIEKSGSCLSAEERILFPLIKKCCQFNYNLLLSLPLLLPPLPFLILILLFLLNFPLLSLFYLLFHVQSVKHTCFFSNPYQIHSRS